MVRQLLNLLFALLLLNSCASDKFDKAVDTVFATYGGEVKSSTVHKVSTDNGEEYFHIISVKWAGNFPDNLVDAALRNIACIYYQNLPTSEKENIDYVIGQLSDTKSSFEMTVPKNELIEFEILYPISLTFFRAVQANDSSQFHKLAPDFEPTSHRQLFETLDELESLKGQITDVLFKGCVLAGSQAIVTHMYYTKDGSVYEGVFKLNRNTKVIEGVEFNN